MKEMDLYKLWVSRELEDSELNEELAAIKNDVDSIQDRFYRDLEFGTAGLRGVLGAGTNRMNIYTIRRATQGFATHVTKKFGDGAKVAIGYDSRIKSDVFAKETAKVLAANGIKVFMYKQLMPVPCLSFAVRELECQAGVMVTASHNPAKYNGYKVYGGDGCQITSEAADKILSYIESTDMFHGISIMDFEEAVKDGLVEMISPEVEEKFIQAVLKQRITNNCVRAANLTVAYTPLNGAGNIPVRTVLDRIGISKVCVVEEQEKPDGHFPTCPFPNPEISEALDLALKLAKKESADLVLATDPDCDRVGIAVPDKNGEFVLLTGNEVGAMLLEYICMQRIKQGTMPENPVMVSTIVSTSIVKEICKKYGVEYRAVLTGFKWIGEQIFDLEQAGHPERYILGFEESYGYLVGTHARDKDAVVASMLICEMAAYLKTQGMSLLDFLEKIYSEYGNYLHVQQSFMCEGITGMEKIQETMHSLRNNPPAEIAGLKVLAVADYKLSQEKDIATGNMTTIDLPKSDVLRFDLENNANIFIRPSGTEPKIKAYYTAVADSKEKAQALQAKMKEDFTVIMGI